MLYALEPHGQRVSADVIAEEYHCPLCKAPVRARRGFIRVHHFAHHAREDCDPWKEGESEWHLSWKALVPPDYCEVIVGEHRADILIPAGQVVELQHSPMPAEEAWIRENFWGERLIWLFDARPFIGHLDLRPRDKYWTFRWKWPRQWMALLHRPQYWDLGHGRILDVRAIYPRPPCGGWGYMLDASQFWASLFPGNDGTPRKALELLLETRFNVWK